MNATLNGELNALRAQFMTKVDPKIREAMTRGDDALLASGIAALALHAGDQAPDFTLPDAQGNPVNLGELLQRGPVVVSFYRGGWCPYCNLELRALQAVLPEIERLGANLVAISPQTPDATLATAEKNDLAFAVLSDKGATVARAFGVAFELSEELRPIYDAFGHALPVVNGTPEWVLPIPATYVIDRDARISLAYVDSDYRKRLEPTDILKALANSRGAEMAAAS